MAKSPQKIHLDAKTLAVLRELGRQGGQLGGPARAAKLSKARRQEIAREAAKARWKAVKREAT